MATSAWGVVCAAALLGACAQGGAAGPGPEHFSAEAAVPADGCHAATAIPDGGTVLTWAERDALSRLRTLCEQLARLAEAPSPRQACAHAGLSRVAALRGEALRAADALARTRAEGDLPASMALSERLLALADDAPRAARSSCAR